MTQDADAIRRRSAGFYDGRGQERIVVRERDRNIPVLLARLVREEAFSLIDIGCGNGLVASLAKDRFPAAEIHGIDLGEKTVATARAIRSDVTYAVSDELLGDVPDGRFGYATCRMSIHHYPDIEAHFAAVRRVLEPGGRYLVMDIVPPPAWSDALNEVFLRAEELAPGDGHLRYRTRDEYADVCAATGFRELFYEESDFPVDWPWDGRYTGVVGRLIAAAAPAFREWLLFEDRGERFAYRMPLGNLACEAAT
jgi:ubiquinone/menaquinone biosynthesis C-methylase UbiE